MTKEEIIELDKYFECYSTSLYHSAFYYPKSEEARQVCRKLYHKEHDNFHIIIFDDTLEVYQADTDHEIFGIELENMDKLITRFESFTGEQVDNIEIRIYDEDSANS